MGIINLFEQTLRKWVWMMLPPLSALETECTLLFSLSSLDGSLSSSEVSSLESLVPIWLSTLSGVLSACSSQESLELATSWHAASLARARRCPNENEATIFKRK